MRLCRCLRARATAAGNAPIARPLRHLPGWGVLAAGLVLAGCSPALDWRAVQPTGTPLTVWLPCKADQAVREAPLAGPGAPPVALRMVGCKADGRTFSVGAVALPPDGADVGAAAVAAAWIAAWQRAHWAALGAGVSGGDAPPGWQPVPCLIPGAVQARCWRGPARDTAGQLLAAELHWASDGRWLVQAAVLGESLPPLAHEQFFGAVRWR